MLGPVAHVGYLVRDLDAAVESFMARFELKRTRSVELAQFTILAEFFGAGSGDVELFTITDPALLAKRLGGREILLDHTAFAVTDLDAVAARLARDGVRFSGPDHRVEVHEPFVLGATRQLWTIPETSLGQSLQLIES